jgi:hypothetical protein
MSRRPPNDHTTTTIRSGVTPAPQGTGQLDRDRAEWLDEQLRGLAAARTHAWAEIRTYVEHATGGQP